MIGMRVRNRRDKKMSRRPIPNDCPEPLECGSAIALQQICQSLIGQSEKTHARRANTQNAQRPQRFRAPQFSPALPISCVQAPLAFQHTLRPRIIIAIRRINDTNGSIRTDGMLQNDAASERFVDYVRPALSGAGQTKHVGRRHQRRHVRAVVRPGLPLRTPRAA